jgi:hypothetical protein
MITLAKKRGLHVSERAKIQATMSDVSLTEFQLATQTIGVETLCHKKVD